MAGKAQLLILTLLICSFLLGGCNPPGLTGKTETPIPADEQKARLLERINRRFEDPEAHFLLGQLYQKERDWDKAEYYYDIAFSFDPVYWPAQAAKVKVLQETGDTSKAEWSADNFISQAGGSADRLLELGLAFQTQDLDKYALACYQRALELAPNSADVHRHMGYYYLAKDDEAQAERHLVRSFQIDPLQPEVAYELGWMRVHIDIPGKTDRKMKEPDRAGQQSEKKATQ